MSSDKRQNLQGSLINQADLSADIELDSRKASDQAWVDVIQQMDSIYTDLIHSQVELEDTNSALSKAYNELHLAHEELKSAQQQLIQSEKMASLGRLVAGVAHELNNPISFVFANMHALQSYHSKFRYYIDAIHDNVSIEEREKLREKYRIDRMMDDIAPLIEGSMEGAERVSDIVKNLRKYATPQQQDKQSLNLVAVIKRTLKWVLKATSLKVNIIEHLPENLYTINNEGYIHQILINLIQNAIDALQSIKKPSITISLTNDTQHINISVCDNGPGIEQEHVTDIFDPFYTTKPVGSGTGLGLSISLGLARDQCNGDLKFRNHPKGGAEFIFSLPMVTV